jgi:hypothetical protein
MAECRRALPFVYCVQILSGIFGVESKLKLKLSVEK